MRYGLTHVRHVLYDDATSFLSPTLPPPRDPFQKLRGTDLLPRQVLEKQREESAATEEPVEAEKNAFDAKPLDPPRPATKIIDSPQPSEEEEVEELAASRPPPNFAQLPPQPPVLAKKSSRIRASDKESPVYLESDTEKGPAWGACDPREVFHVRQAIDAARGDLPPKFCLAEYTAADNSLQDLQEGFDSWGQAKCGNDFWIADSRDKCSKLLQCIANVLESSPNVRFEDRYDMKHKMREVMAQVHDHLGYVNYFMPDYAEAHPTPAMQAQYQQQFAAHGGDESATGPGGPAPPINPGKGSPPRKEPATEKDIYLPQDSGSSPWSEPGSPPSIIRHASLSECALLLASLRSRQSPSCRSPHGHRRDEIARSFICEAH
mmetsp:Transcript_79569/g.138066  ORF Transcript_79569/g.138066 Transcript_79569/m.138066 type:complete len:377 (-) Transcript_79569:12-1142(-)